METPKPTKDSPTNVQMGNIETIKNVIYEIRGQKVMLDSDLADMYEVEVAQLKRQVRRNIERFPEDFMFELTPDEVAAIRCQNGILIKQTHLSRRLKPRLPQMLVSQIGALATTGRAHDEAFLDEEGLTDLFDGARVLAHRRSDGVHAHRTTLELVDDGR